MFLSRYKSKICTGFSALFQKVQITRKFHIEHNDYLKKVRITRESFNDILSLAHQLIWNAH